MFAYNPYIGCKKCSRSCDICKYYHFNKDSKDIIKSATFDILIKKNKNKYLIKSNTIVEVCTNSDFFIKEASFFRKEIFDMFKIRKDLIFNIKTKRLSEVIDELDPNFYDIYPNINIYSIVSSNYEFKREVNALKKLNTKNKYIIIHPLYDKINLDEILDDNYNIKEVMLLGDDYYDNPLYYDDILELSLGLKKLNIAFTFVSTGKYIIKDNKKYFVKYDLRNSQAFKSKLSHS